MMQRRGQRCTGIQTETETETETEADGDAQTGTVPSSVLSLAHQPSLSAFCAFALSRVLRCKCNASTCAPHYAHCAYRVCACPRPESWPAWRGGGLSTCILLGWERWITSNGALSVSHAGDHKPLRKDREHACWNMALIAALPPPPMDPQHRC